MSAISQQTKPDPEVRGGGVPKPRQPESECCSLSAQFSDVNLVLITLFKGSKGMKLISPISLISVPHEQVSAHDLEFGDLRPRG